MATPPLPPTGPVSPESPVSPVTPAPPINPLTAPFRQYLQDRQDLLDGGSERLDEHIELIRLWPQRQKRLQQMILAPLRKWLTTLKRIALPPRNIKRYNREKKRLLRAKYPAIYSWQGFHLKAGIGFLQVLNMIRIVIIISIFLGSLFLLGYFIINLFRG